MAVDLIARGMAGSTAKKLNQLSAVQNVADVVATKAALDEYNTTGLEVDDKIQVLADETQHNAATIYNWNGESWEYVGAYGNLVTGVKGEAETDYRIGNVNITKTNIGLGKVDNTSDMDKPLSTPQAQALKAHTDRTDNPHSITKTQVGLSNVENKTMDDSPIEGSSNYVKSGGVYTELEKKVDKVEGKGLSTNDYTNEEKSKLEGIEAGAQVNVLEGVQVNGSDLTINENKKVNIQLKTINGNSIEGSGDIQTSSTTIRTWRD